MNFDLTPKSTFATALMASARRDLQIIVVLVLAVFLLGLNFDAFDKFTQWTVRNDRWRIGDLALSFIFLAVAFCVFSIRRWKDVSTEINQRELADAELRRGNVSLERNVEERTNELRLANEQLQCELQARQLTEAAFNESEARYRQIVEAATDIIYRTDANGNFTFVNPITGRILKRLETEILGRNFLEFIRPDFQRTAAEFYQRQFDQSCPHTYFEYPVLTGDGSVVWLGQNVQLLFENGRRTGYQAVARDITDRKQSEAAQRRAEEYHNLFQLANDSILILDPQEELVLDVNDKACETYGLSREEFIGRSLKDLSQDVEQGRSHLDLLLTHGRYDEFETVQLRADGTPIHFIISASVIEYEGRQAVLSINRDITERARAATERQRLEEQLRQSQKMESIGTLAGGVAHDFNNLLTAIKGYSDLSLRRLGANDPIRSNLEQINKAADRSAALTRQLLAFSRLQRLESKPVNLNDLIGDLMKMLRRIIGEDVEIRLHAAPQLKTVLADPGQIEQVIMNLAVNARDAMPGGGLLTIETHNVELDEVYCQKRSYAKPGLYVQVMASDSGIGMSAEVRARVFEPFFTTKEVGKGTGLGLATAYGVVKQHNGFIEVYSEVGQGTVFKVYLPVVQEVVKENEVAIRLPVPGGHEVILLAEDEEALREMTKTILEDLGYEVLVVENGQAALEAYRAQPEKIDLLLFDMVMPRLGGFQAYEQISAQDSTVPVVFMTGYSVALTKELGRQNQAINEAGVRIIQKPYSFEQLARPVREALDAAPVKMPA